MTMLRVFISSLLFIFVLYTPIATSAETKKACPDNLPTTHQVACEVRIELEESEQELRNALEILEQKHQSERGKEHLKTSQAAWISYRNTSCLYENNIWASGTGTGANISFCKIRYNKERTAILEGYRSTIYFD